MAEKKFSQPPNSQSHFAAVPAAEIERSKFDRSHSYKTTFDAGLLIPVYVDDILPGDTFHMKSTAFARLATPLKPVMDNMYLDTHFFFVPNRLIWDEFQQFMGERKSPTDDPDNILHPRASISLNRPIGDVADYFGLPRDEGAPAANIYNVNPLPFRAYQLIWNEWYRDQNLQIPLPFSKASGDTAGTTIGLNRRNKRPDYFTSCLPWPQKGDPVTIPVLTGASVVTNNTPPTFRTASDATMRTIGPTIHETTALVGYSGSQVAGGQNFQFGNQTGLTIDLTSATAVTINDLRTAFQVQRLLERDARGGTRYIELILSHFGVTSDDARLQRPEYLGGGTAMVNVNPIAVTASTTDSVQGELTAFGTVVGKAGFTKSFTEHGWIIGLVSVRADLTYQQGVERMWSRKTRYDYYWPALSHLGEQAVLIKEICVEGSPTGDSALDKAPFGYQERYAEYRYKPSRITGQFISADSTSLDVWHLAQDLIPPVLLTAIFITDNPPIDRIIAVPGEPHFLLDMWFDLQCERPMPVYSVPGLIDHF